MVTTQLTKPREVAVNLWVGDYLVLEMRAPKEDVLPGQLVFRGTTYYPSRIREDGNLEFPEIGVQEVLGMRCEPLILVDSNGGIVAIYYTPGPEAQPQTLE